MVCSPLLTIQEQTAFIVRGRWLLNLTCEATYRNLILKLCKQNAQHSALGETASSRFTDVQTDGECSLDPNLMAIVHCHNDLLKQPSTFLFWQSTMFNCVALLNEIHQIAGWSILIDNAEMSLCQEDFMELDDVGMHGTEALMKDFLANILDAADTRMHATATAAANTVRVLLNMMQALTACLNIDGKAYGGALAKLCVAHLEELLSTHLMATFCFVRRSSARSTNAEPPIPRSPSLRYLL